MAIRKHVPVETVKCARALIRQVAVEAGVHSHLIYADDRNGRVVKARYEAIRRIHTAFPMLSTSQIGKLFERDHSTICYALGQRTNRKPKF